MNGRKLRLGTRGSDLATTQSGQVARAVEAATGVGVELVIIKTRGDQVTDRPLQEVGGKGLFTKEIEEALLQGEIDFAVHSMKDMPTESPEGLLIASVPKRVDPRDVLVGSELDRLPQGAVVGTGSVRRALQLRAARPDRELKGIPGNVDTRINKQRAGEYAAIVLAMAGLVRLGREVDVTEALAPAVMIPAVGQGALAVQARRRDDDTLRILEAVHDADTGVCVAAERAFLAEIQGGCSAPAAAHAHLQGEEIVIDGVWAADEASPVRRAQLRGDRLHVHALGTELARRVRDG
ncbi:MAG: hydroxymethylbilane synthase [Myxococcota bacterium]